MMNKIIFLRHLCYSTYKCKQTYNIKPNKTVKALTNIPSVNDNTTVKESDIRKYFIKNIIDTEEYEYQITKLYINYGMVRKDIFDKIKEEMKRNVIKY